MDIKIDWKTDIPDTRDKGHPSLSPIVLVTIEVHDNDTNEVWRTVNVDRYDFDSECWMNTDMGCELLQHWTQHVVAWSEKPEPYNEDNCKIIQIRELLRDLKETLSTTYQQSEEGREYLQRIESALSN